MKNSLLLSALLLAAVPASAQLDNAPAGRWPVPDVSPAQTQKLMPLPTLTLHLRDVSLREALEELGRQSGVAFAFSYLPRAMQQTQLSVDVETPSFYEAWEAIKAAAKIELTMGRENQSVLWEVRLNGDKNKTGVPPSATGPFVLEVRGVSETFIKALDVTQATPRLKVTSDELKVWLMTRLDPRLPIVDRPRLLATRADDEEGRSVLRPDSDFQSNEDYYAAFGDIWKAPSTELHFERPQPGAQKLAHLEGQIIYLLATNYDLWEVPDVLNAENKIHEFGNGEQYVRATLKSAKFKDQSVELKLELRQLYPGEANWKNLEDPLLKVSNILSWCRLEDANGTPLFARSSGGGSGGGSAYISLTFSLRPALDGTKPNLALPLKFSFAPPTQWRQIQVPFRFENVPLP